MSQPRRSDTFKPRRSVADETQSSASTYDSILALERSLQRQLIAGRHAESPRYRHGWQAIGCTATLYIALSAAYALLSEGRILHTSHMTFLVQLMLAGLAPVVWAMRAGVAGSWLRATSLGLLCLAVSLQTFPLIPSPGVEGVFFSSLGATSFLFSLGRSVPFHLAVWLRLTASLCFVCAPLCQQSFALVSLLFGIACAGRCAMDIATKQRRVGPAIGLLGASAAPALAVIAVAYALLLKHDGIDDAVAQLGNTQLSDLRLAGYEAYRDSKAGWTLLAGLFAAWAGGIAERISSRWGALFELAAGCCIGASIVYVSQVSGHDTLEAGRAVFFLVLGVLLGRLILVSGWYLAATRTMRENETAGLLAALLFLGVAWSASISSVPLSPILAVGLLAAAFEPGLARRRSSLIIQLPFVAAAAAACYFQLSPMATEPYRDAPRERVLTPVEVVNGLEV